MDASIFLPSDPNSIDEALAVPHKEEWLKAIQKEAQVFRDVRLLSTVEQ
jgi:hypothetical protein